MATLHDVEVMRRDAFSARALQQNAVLAGTFPDPHPPGWVDRITTVGVAMIVVPGLVDLDGFVDLDALRPAWCVMAPAVRRR